MYLGMWIWSRQPAGVGTEHQDEEEDHTTVDATPVIQEQEIETTVYTDPPKLHNGRLEKTLFALMIVTDSDSNHFIYPQLIGKLRVSRVAYSETE